MEVWAAAAAGVFPLPLDWIIQAGATGLLAVVAVMIFFGWLVPRFQYNKLEQDRDYWRKLALKSLGHVDELLPAAHITTEVARALSDATTREQP